MSTTIDLGKLRFNWVGTWDSTVEYEINDLVKHGGDVFVYIYGVKTTANLTTNATYWALVQEGMSWQGEYDAAVAYLPHQVVHHANNSYVCILEEPVAGATEPPNATYWQLLVTGYKFEGLYNDSTTYQVDDIVYYGANTFICIQNTTGSNNPEAVAYWAVFSHGLQWEGVYVAATAYQKDDVVAYGANVYIAKHDTTGNLPLDTAHFDTLTDGIRYTSDWDSSETDYKINDVVVYGGNSYIATADLPTVNSSPSVNTAQWDVLSSGIQWEGVYVAATAYIKDDIVSYGGNTYISKQDTTGNSPEDTVNWDPLNNGIQARGDWATATQYYLDDVVSYGGQTYICLITHASGIAVDDVAAGKWSQFSAGLEWKGNWTSSTLYYVNNIVNSGGATFICSVEHTSANFGSESANWDSFANAGTDVALTITAHGDLLYRDATGPARLGNGITGQLLTTKGANADPAWEDAPSTGILTVDKTQTTGFVTSFTEGIVLYSNIVYDATTGKINSYTETEGSTVQNITVSSTGVVTVT